jgi:hypothetical protein
MDDLLDDRCPTTCLALGLDCRNCVERSAEKVAVICHGMTPSGVRSIFAQVYPSAGCAHMAVAFESTYFSAAAPRKPMLMAIAAA